MLKAISKVRSENGIVRATIHYALLVLVVAMAAALIIPRFLAPNFPSTVFTR